MSENLQILVIEDDKDGQEVIARMLKHHRIPHTVTGTGEEALQLVQTGQYNGCIIDLALPGIDGWQVLNEIRHHPATAQIPCVAVTAYHSPEVAVQAIEQGFAAYFPKPLEATSFVRQIMAVFTA